MSSRASIGQIMKSEEEKLPSRRRLIVYGTLLFSFFCFMTIFLALSSVDQFNIDKTIVWSWFYPSMVFVTIMMGILFLRPIFIANPVPSAGEKRTKLFRYEDQTLVTCLIGAALGPLLFQPIVDYAVMPAIGYEYCEARTTYGSAFGVAVYAYVPDPELCVAPVADG